MEFKRVHGTEIPVNSRFMTSAPITEEALLFIKKHTAGSTVLEIGCGSGIYAKLLREIVGVKVIATDVCSIEKKGLLPSYNWTRMAKFTYRRAINNMIEKNAVEAVQNLGQNKSLSLFLSFPLPDSSIPINFRNSQQYDEIALRNFKGNKFFLIAMYGEELSIKKYDPANSNGSTGSYGFHYYLAEEWKVIDILLLETGRTSDHSYCYLIYFERKTTNNMSGGKNRKCPKNNAKDFKLNTVDRGIDGKMWIVKKRRDGVKFWKRVNNIEKNK